MWYTYFEVYLAVNTAIEANYPESADLVTEIMSYAYKHPGLPHVHVLYSEPTHYATRCDGWHIHFRPMTIIPCKEYQETRNCPHMTCRRRRRLR